MMVKSAFLLALSMTAFAILTGHAGESNANERPNILLVMADDQGYGDAGYNDHPFVKTPHLDAMARDGVVFDHFYAAAPVCSPTRASVMTGRHPFRCNVPNHGHYMHPAESTIAEALQSVGYVTGHFGKWHIGSVQPESATSPGGAGFDEWLSGLNFFDNDPYLSHNGTYKKLEGPGSVISMDATLEFLRKHAKGDQPMFAVTWFPAPHDPHQEIPQAIDGAATMYQKEAGKKAGYYREITLLDQQVGRLRGALKELEIADNTLLFYCSDNGGLNPQTSGGRAMKGSIYEGGLRVPAILQWPSRYQHQVIATPASTCDLYPTLLAVADVEIEDQPTLDGINLLPILAGNQDQRPPLGFWHGHSQGQSTWSDRIIKSLKEAQDAGKPNPLPQRVLKNVYQYPKFDRNQATRGHAAWNKWPWKLHRIENKGRVRWELYNLADDPMERADVSGDAPDVLESMQKELEAWQKSVLQSWSGADYGDQKTGAR